MQYSHAVIVRVPGSVKCEEKKTKLDIPVLRKQQSDLAETLKEAGLEILELTVEDGCPAAALLPGNAAVMIRGIALITRPKKHTVPANLLRAVFEGIAWEIYETPEKDDRGKNIVLEGADILYTGAEIFVGTRKNGTNFEGVATVARVFKDIPVIPIALPAQLPLTHYVSMALPKVVVTSKSKEAQNIIKQMDGQTTSTCRTLTMENESAASVISVNKRLVIRQDAAEEKFNWLQRDKVELWALDVSEMTKIATPFSKFCLLFKKPEIGKHNI